VDDGAVRVKIHLPPDHPFAENMREDIEETLSRLWDVQKADATGRGIDGQNAPSLRSGTGQGRQHGSRKQPTPSFRKLHEVGGT